MRIATLLLPVVFAVLLVACGGDDEDAAPTATGVPATPTAAALAPPGATEFTVLAGKAESSFDIEQFMPATVRIRAGDTIVWQGSGFEGHTVTFFPDGLINIGVADYLPMAPDRPGMREFNQIFALSSEAQGSYDGTAYTNSGFFGVPAPQEYRLTFPTAGTYAYLCMIHPLHMRGVVIVEQAEAAVPAPDAVAADGQRLLAAYTDEAQTAADTVVAEREAAAPDAPGQAWQVSVGYDTPHAQVLAFLPGALEIDAGDKVIFWNSDRDFHNVIFAPEGTDPPQFPVLETVEGRQGFRLLINPEAEHEIPAPTDAGPSNLFSSGLMGIGFPRFYYEVTLTQPGTYRYYCTVHTLAGMAGVITVRTPGG